MGRRYNRNRLLSNINAKFKTFFVDSGEMAVNEVGRFMADIKINTVTPAFLEFMVNGSGDNVAWG